MATHMLEMALKVMSVIVIVQKLSMVWHSHWRHQYYWSITIHENIKHVSSTQLHIETFKSFITKML